MYNYIAWTPGADPELSQGGFFSSIFHGTRPLLTKPHLFFYCSMNKRGVLLSPKNPLWIRHWTQCRAIYSAAVVIIIVRCDISANNSLKLTSFTYRYHSFTGSYTIIVLYIITTASSGSTLRLRCTGLMRKQNIQEKLYKRIHNEVINTGN